MLGMNCLGIPSKETFGDGLWGAFPHSLPIKPSKNDTQHSAKMLAPMLLLARLEYLDVG